mmetsp:Transcript_41185/g.102464  ORF Transcript_41185/g.102464 Transcript_41185/m.102464 type:complete len:84 (+) Transcript_41185:174-425(+)
MCARRVEDEGGVPSGRAFTLHMHTHMPQPTCTCKVCRTWNISVRRYFVPDRLMRHGATSAMRCTHHATEVDGQTQTASCNIKP